MGQEQTLEQKVGAKLVALREKAKLLQTDVAAGSGCGYRSICRWELGEGLPSSRNLQKLAAFFETTPDRILR